MSCARRSYVVLAESEGKTEHLFKPDVGITTVKDVKTKEAQTPVAVSDPAANGDSVAMRAFISTEYREAFIEVHALQPHRHLVTCLEVLSPSNKRLCQAAVTATEPGRGGLSGAEKIELSAQNPVLRGYTSLTSVFPAVH